ncbi:MAG: PAS domain S-box protein [Erythrobacter sp.]|nr:PAS domain S-box protein [Erythrobacter sp.]
MDSHDYAAVLDAISDGIVAFGMDRRIIFTNHAFDRMCGPEKTGLTYDFDEFLDAVAASPETRVSIHDALSRSEPFSCEVPVFKRSTETFCCQLDLKPMPRDDGTLLYFVGILRDVSLIKEAEARQAECEREYQFIFDNVLAGIIIHSPDSKIKFANPKAIEMFDLDPEAIIDKAADDRQWGFLRPDGSPMPNSELPFVRAMAEQAPVRGVTIGRRNPRDGKVTWALSNAFLATDDQNEVVSVLVSFTDVTRLIESEMEAQAYRERFELAARATQDVIFEWNIETGAFYANNAFETVYGYKPPDLMGRHNLDARNSVDEHQNLVRDVTLEAIASGKERFSLTHKIKRDDGSIGHIVIRAFIAHDAAGRATRVIGTATDLGQLNAALIALEESETRFRIIADTVSDVLWDHNIETGQSWVTPDWDKRLGISVDQIEFQHNHWMKEVDPADFERLASSYQHALDSGASTWEIEYQMLGSDGEKIIVSVKGSILRNADGKAYRVLGNLRDITAKRRQQEGYTRARALEAVGQLTGGVAHDFNNLLMIIQGNAELLEMSSLSDDDAESVSLINTAAQSAATLTRRLLAFSGDTRFTGTRFKITELFDTIQPLLRAALPESIAISFNVDPNIWDVDGDANGLEQAIVNLAMNSRDAMPNGGQVTISSKNVIVEDGSAPVGKDLKPGAYVVVSLFDDGKGMPADVLSKAFEPYFTTKEFGKGTGLGLSTVYGFATQSGGDVTIASGIGCGTTVTLYLPAHKDMRNFNDGSIGADDAEITVSENRILLVEDQQQVRKHVEKMLLRYGYSVASVADAGSALAILNGGGVFDLLFTDIVMPGGMNGHELATAAKLIAPRMKVLYTSGYAATAFEQIGLGDQSSINILQKPYKTAQLKAAIARALAA